MEETQPGGGSSLTLDVADDVEGAKEDGGLQSCTLDLGFDNLNEDDELDVRINGEAVAWSSMERSEDGWGYTAFDGEIYHTTMSERRVEGTVIRFDVTGLPIRKGENELLVRLIKGAGPHFEAVRS